MRVAVANDDGLVKRWRFFVWPTFVVAGAILLFGVGYAPALAYSEALAATVFLVSLPLGAALFAAIGVCMGATWWHPLHGVFVAAARQIVVPAIAVGVVLALGIGSIYSWTEPAVAAGHVVHQKIGWLNVTFFLGRAAAILILWVWMVRGIARRVQEALENPSAVATARMVRAGVVFVILFAITISVAWWDWLMSVEPEWFSTMQGVYGFACVFLGGIAAVTILALRWERDGKITLTNAQLHDLGKMLFAFAFFWGYIWFCQFMLIWYSNIPEESAWFVHRLEGSWAIWFVLNLIISFVLPFVLLLSAQQKRNRSLLLQVAALVLVGRVLDIWLALTPSLAADATFPLYLMATLYVVVTLNVGFRSRAG